MGYDAESLVAAMPALGAEIAHRRAELTRLDQEIGDGDHDENLARGFSAVLTKLRTVEPETPDKVMSLVVTTLISTVGATATTPWQARKGRAFYLGERSIGHLDPGAQSTAYVLASLAASAAGHAAPSAPAESTAPAEG